jgi:hypothetical protein
LLGIWKNLKDIGIAFIGSSHCFRPSQRSEGEIQIYPEISHWRECGYAIFNLEEADYSAKDRTGNRKLTAGFPAWLSGNPPTWVAKRTWYRINPLGVLQILAASGAKKRKKNTLKPRREVSSSFSVVPLPPLIKVYFCACWQRRNINRDQCRY